MKVVGIVLLVFFVKFVALQFDPASLFYSYFILIPHNYTYAIARKKCYAWDKISDRKFWLASNITERENAIIYEYMSLMHFHRAWIGVNRISDKKDLNIRTFQQEREDGSLEPNVRYFWGPKEPNNFRKHKERCVEIRVLKKNTPRRNWNDAPCDHENVVICRNPFKIVGP